MTVKIIFILTADGYEPPFKALDSALISGFQFVLSINSVSVHVLSLGSQFRFSVQALSSGSQFRFSVQALSSGSQFRFSVKALSSGS